MLTTTKTIWHNEKEILCPWYQIGKQNLENMQQSGNPGSTTLFGRMTLEQEGEWKSRQICLLCWISLLGPKVNKTSFYGELSQDE